METGILPTRTQCSSNTKSSNHQSRHLSSHASISRSSSSSDEESDSSDSDNGCQDHWAKVQREAALDSNWDFAGKLQILAAPVTYKKGRNLKWDSIPYGEFTCIYFLVTLNELEPVLQRNEHLQFTLDSYSGQISVHPPKHKLSKTCFNLVANSWKSRTPLKGLMVFTDGSGRFH